jgi:hypothetical protein
MLTWVIPGQSNTPAALEELEHQVAERIGYECLNVEWLEDFAVRALRLRGYLQGARH